MPFENILRRSVPKTATVERPMLTEEGKKAIESGLAEFIRLTEEHAHLQSEHDRALGLVTKATAEIVMLRETVSDLKARCTTYQIERDESVSKYAKLQAFLISLYAQMRAFDVPVISASHFAAVDPAAEQTTPEPPKTASKNYLDTVKVIGDFSNGMAERDHYTSRNP